MIGEVYKPTDIRVKSSPYPLDGILVLILSPVWALYRRRLLSVLNVKIRFFSRLARGADQFCLDVGGDSWLCCESYGGGTGFVFQQAQNPSCHVAGLDSNPENGR